ncbi:MAG TPA: hypothetical protein DHV22_05920 [Xanthomarina gelatinilytica]|uniref:Uncharacterized protein n=1 Tax=Xanthomarina gelatinilytica TaxID=1137281 RepID=A0A3D6BQM0_9FLAO|nr:hypothetical protein [Xanthomarina gelatinilytica]
MLDNVSIQQIKLIRHEYDKLKTQKQKDAYIDDLTDQVYERRHELYELWALQKEEKAPVVKMPSHTSPTKSAKIIGVKNYEHSNKHKF